VSTKTKAVGGRPSKYDEKYHPKLAYFMALARLKDSQIAEQLNIALSTLSKWKNEHPEFMESLKRGKEDPDDAVQGALIKRALGYQVEEVTKERRKIYDDDGNEIGTEMVPTKVVVKDMAPDTTACIFWLKNRRPEQWREKKEIEMDIYVLKPEQYEVKEIDDGDDDDYEAG
jgi:hypothetical protein